MAVILTEKQKKSPLYKYYELPIDPVPKDLAEKIQTMSHMDAEGMAYADINNMFDEGYLSCEFGLFHNPDGGSMVANLTDMPGVTTEMFDWWFAWHGLDSMRYIIWDKDDHYYCQTQNVRQALDESLSMKERYWNTEHEVKEALSDDMEPIPTRLKFVPPETIGFDPERLKTFKGTIIATPGPLLMFHFLRPTEKGSELRSRFFVGYMATENGIVRVPALPTEDEKGRTMLMHNIKEFTHLAKILPGLYNEYKDNFTVDLE